MTRLPLTLGLLSLALSLSACPSETSSPAEPAQATTEEDRSATATPAAAVRSPSAPAPALPDEDYADEDYADEDYADEDYADEPGPTIEELDAPASPSRSSPAPRRTDDDFVDEEEPYQDYDEGGDSFDPGGLDDPVADDGMNEPSWDEEQVDEMQDDWDDAMDEEQGE